MQDGDTRRLLWPCEKPMELRGCCDVRRTIQTHSYIVAISFMIMTLPPWPDVFSQPFGFKKRPWCPRFCSSMDSGWNPSSYMSLKPDSREVVMLVVRVSLYYAGVSKYDQQALKCSGPSLHQRKRVFGPRCTGRVAYGSSKDSPTCSRCCWQRSP